MQAGNWAGDKPTPATEEGVRRPICDMALLIFHLVLRAFTVQGVDIAMAERILEFNLARFPNGESPLPSPLYLPVRVLIR